MPGITLHAHPEPPGERRKGKQSYLGIYMRLGWGGGGGGGVREDEREGGGGGGAKFVE